MNADEQAIAEVLKKYEAALNASSSDAVLPLYAPEGVFMPQGSASAAGTNALRAAYKAVFAAITIKVTFTVVEIHQLAADWAFARTNSVGVNAVHATGASTPEANQELFIFQRIAGEWKIARYCFCTRQSTAEHLVSSTL